MRTADSALHERRRAEILEAAQRCFVAKGFHQSTMAEIAAAADLSMGLLYRYFANKAEIIIAVSALDKADVMFAISTMATSSTAQDAVAIWVNRASKLANDAAYTTLACEVVAEAARNPTLQQRMDADNTEIHAAMAKAVKQLQKRSAINDRVESAVIADVLMMLMDGAIGRAVFDSGLQRSGRTSKIAALIVQMLL